MYTYYLSLSLYLSISLSLYLSISLSLYLSISLSLYLSISLSLYLSISLSVYTYTHLSLSIYIYTCTLGSFLLQRAGASDPPCGVQKRRLCAAGLRPNTLHEQSMNNTQVNYTGGATIQAIISPPNTLSNTLWATTQGSFSTPRPRIEGPEGPASIYQTGNSSTKQGEPLV